MQLSAPTSPVSDPSLAGLLLGGDSVTAASAVTPGSSAGEFAQLFPGLTSTALVAPAPAASTAVSATPAAPLGVTPALRPYTPPTATQPVTAPALATTAESAPPAVETPLPTDLESSLRPSTASSGAPVTGKQSRPSVRPAAWKPPAASPAETPVAVAPALGNLLVPAAPVATELLASPQVPAEPADELLAETPPSETSGDEEEANADTLGESRLVAQAPAPFSFPTYGRPSVESEGLSPATPTDHKAAVAASSLISTPLKSELATDDSNTSPQSAPRAFLRSEIASRQFSSVPSDLAKPGVSDGQFESSPRPELPRRSLGPTDPSLDSGAFAFAAELASEPASTLLVGSTFRGFRPEVPLTTSNAAPESLPPLPNGLRSKAAPVAETTVAAPLTTAGALPSGPYAAAKVAASLPVVASLSAQAEGASVVIAGAFSELSFAATPRPTMVGPQPSSEASPSLVSDSGETEIALTPELTSRVRAVRAETPFVAPKAKFAARSEGFGVGQKSALGEVSKTFLNVDEEEFGGYGEKVGTDVAKSDPIMSTATFTERPALAAVPPHAQFAPVARVAETDLTSLAGIETAPAPESVASAHRAVEAVLVAADRFSSGDQHSVNLQFSVGGTDLNVRVEMRADEVRATFRTDSPELRSALAHEWQAAGNSVAGERSFRLAPPVITSSHGDTAGSLSFAGGDASSRQRDSGSRHSENEVFASLAATGRASRSAASTTVSEPTVTTTSHFNRRGAHRLLTHA